jgi:diguanylate cyclase (GGDEF)-like protein
MTGPADSEYVPGQPGTRFDPYVRLVRSLMPRASCVAMFGPSGELHWSTDPMTGPDLMNIVDDALLAARTNPDSAGQLRLLAGQQPVYLCALRDSEKQLLALLAVLSRPSEAPGDKRSNDFSFAHSLLGPALECLRRELVAGATIDELTQIVGGLDKNLNLLLQHGGAEPSDSDANELQQLLQQTIELLRACTGALLVPEKSLTLVRAPAGTTPDTQFLMRAHRRLLQLAQTQREPLILNETQSATAPDLFSYRVLCCSLRSRAGRPIGVLALMREPSAEAFTERDAHIAEILARKAIGGIDNSYDSLSGLYTRSEFERRLRQVLGQRANRNWSALYINVDQLHMINEKSGMHVGDGLLGQLGELIRQRLPPGAFGARISGDRFAAMLPAHVDDAERFAESLREGATRLAMVHEEGHQSLSISVGITPLDQGATELAHVLAPAETACKAAKDRGRNRVEVYHARDVSIMRRHADISIAGQVKEAIDSGRLHLNAQLILPFAAADSARPHYSCCCA